MMHDDTAHAFADWLLRTAHRISSPHVRDWGAAMLAELAYIQSSWATLAWAVGGTGVLMKQTILHSLFSVRGGGAPLASPGPFRSEGPMRRFTFRLVLLGASVFLVLLFAPSFLQALNVSATSWLWTFHQTDFSARELNHLAEQARAALAADSRWMDAITGAFAARKYNSYFSTLLDLDHSVMARHHLTSPLLILPGISRQPAPNIRVLQHYAYITLARGKDLEAHGDLARARSEYWTVARFGQLLHLQAQTEIERLAGAMLQRDAYRKLASMAERSGHEDERSLLAYQVESLSPPHLLLPDNGFRIEVYSWNAEIGMISMSILMFSGMLLGVWRVSVLARRLRAGSGSGQLGSLFRALGFAGALGLLVSSLTLFLSYRPYAELFRRFTESHGAQDAHSLMAFWGFAEVPWVLQGFFLAAPGRSPCFCLPLAFWALRSFASSPAASPRMRLCSGLFLV